MIDKYYNKNKTRQTGRTTALACAAQMIGAIFVVYTTDDMCRIQKQFPGLDVRTKDIGHFIGNNKPVIFDHRVIELMNEIFKPKTQARVSIECSCGKVLKTKHIWLTNYYIEQCTCGKKYKVEANFTDMAKRSSGEGSGS